MALTRAYTRFDAARGVAKVAEILDGLGFADNHEWGAVQFVYLVTAQGAPGLDGTGGVGAAVFDAADFFGH